jgi:hypothetical protein
MRRQDLIAEMRVHSTKRAGVRIELVPQAEPGSFRPTGLMETISRAVEDTAGASKNEIRSAAPAPYRGHGTGRVTPGIEEESTAPRG